MLLLRDTQLKETPFCSTSPCRRRSGRPGGDRVSLAPSGAFGLLGRCPAAATGRGRPRGHRGGCLTRAAAFWPGGCGPAARRAGAVPRQLCRPSALERAAVGQASLQTAIQAFSTTPACWRAASLMLVLFVFITALVNRNPLCAVCSVAADQSAHGRPVPPAGISAGWA